MFFGGGNGEFDDNISASSFHFLFSEIIKWCCADEDDIEKVENNLFVIGQKIGFKQTEKILCKQKKRITTFQNLLQLIHNELWKSLFGKTADGVERNKNDKNQFLIFDKNPLTNQFVSVPSNLGDLNVATFIAGIVKGVLDANFVKSNVTTRYTSSKNKEETVFIIDIEDFSGFE
ncbi:Transport protein particle (TRAPP) component [Bonamia ostreae]|uniref:Trafficking protein particle complex subunit n=1 Tax=Bonamia ostreae TaxID=126728 RepID=A0ABV2AIL7_9EUKA